MKAGDASLTTYGADFTDYTDSLLMPIEKSLCMFFVLDSRDVK